MTTLSLYEFLPQNERWLQGLLGVQACLFLSAILLRRVPAAQAGLFFLAAGIVYFAERINDLAARHWQSFATQDYFDAHGIFYSAVVSAPLLATMFVILVRVGGGGGVVVVVVCVWGVTRCMQGCAGVTIGVPGRAAAGNVPPSSHRRQALPSFLPDQLPGDDILPARPNEEKGAALQGSTKAKKGEQERQVTRAMFLFAVTHSFSL